MKRSIPANIPSIYYKIKAPVIALSNYSNKLVIQQAHLTPNNTGDSQLNDNHPWQQVA